MFYRGQTRYKTEYNNFDNFHTFYEFYNNGLLKIETEFYSNGEVQNKTEYDYNFISDSIEVSKKDNYGEIKYFITYDKNGNLTKDGGGIYQYDNLNNLIKQINENFTIRWVYDENGNRLEKFYKGTYTEIHSIFKYIEFDKNKNWTKVIEFRNDQPKFITERTIEYH